MDAEPYGAMSNAKEDLASLDDFLVAIANLTQEQRKFIFGSKLLAQQAHTRCYAELGRQQTEVARLERLVGTAEGRMADSMMDDARRYGSGGN